MSFFVSLLTQRLQETLPATRTNSYAPSLIDEEEEQQPDIMSNMPSASSAVDSTVRNVRSAMPNKGTRIQVAKVMGAFEAGKLPSQDQIGKMIDVVLNSDTLKATGGPGSRTARLGVEGQRVLEKTQGVLAALRDWGAEKNGDDLLQNFFVRSIGGAEYSTTWSPPTWT
jgi:hypothetical protein